MVSAETTEFVRGELEKLREEMRQTVVNLQSEFGRKSEAENLNVQVNLQAQRMSSMENTMELRMQAIQDKLSSLAQTVEDQGETEVTKEKTKRGRTKMTEKKNFGSVPSYSGKQEEFDDWRFKMSTFLSGEKTYKDVLTKLGEFKVLPTEDKVNEMYDEINKHRRDETGEEEIDREEQIWLNHELYQVLSMNLREKALLSVKNIEAKDDIYGLLGWVKLCLECNEMTAERLRGLAGKIYSPERCKKYSEVNASIEEWELQVRLFERNEGKDYKLSPTTKVYSLKQIVPDELCKDIVRLSSQLTTYDDVRSYIAEQVSVRRDLPKNAARGPVKMDLDMVDYSCHPCGQFEEEDNEEEDDEKTWTNKEVLSFMRDGPYKGKGKGKGKFGKDSGSSFEGYCHHCWAYGHRISECRKKTAEMKGKGKGNEKGDGYQKGYQGGFGSGKGYGKDNPTKGKGKGHWGNPGKGAAMNVNPFDLILQGASQTQPSQPDQWGSPASPWGVYSINRKPPGPPPGLPKPFVGRTVWENLTQEDEQDDQESEQEVREEDLKQMENKFNQNFPKAVMSNYSKGSVKNSGEVMRKAKFKPIDRKQTKTLAIFEKMPLKKDLNPVVRTIVPAQSENGWRKMKSVMDSGATESVAHPGENPDYEVMESPGSRNGQRYVSASGDEIENEGEQILEAVTLDGTPWTQKYQSAEVSRPLNSITEICDAGDHRGQLVVFSKWGGVIYNPDGKKTIPFSREDGIYVMETWVKVKDKNATGFTRPGVH